MTGTILIEHRRWIAVGFLIAGAACTSPDPKADTDGTWVGTITTEGNVTTVVNESGSVWGGTARLMEEASIGVEAGDEPYLLGQVRAIGATSDRIYVADSQLDVVRVYDMNGTHLLDIGREGEGPGEFDRPWAIGIDPGGRLMVHGRRRVTVFDLDGAFIETWPYRGVGRPIVVTTDGTAFVSSFWGEGDERILGVVEIAPGGLEERRITGPMFDTDRWGLFASQGGRTMGAGIRYAPGARFAVLPSGAVVGGVSDVYRFEIEYADGRHTVVERSVVLPAVLDAHREWLTDYWTAMMRSVQPDWSWTVNPVPEHKPAFDEFLGDRYGRIWVRRTTETVDVADCDPNPAALDEVRSARSCWRDGHGFDVFEEDSGLFLGHVAAPRAATSLQWPAFLEHSILMVVEDEAGTIMVKRYRLVLPGEEKS